MLIICIILGAFAILALCVWALLVASDDLK